MADKSSNLSLNLPVSTDKFDHDIFLRQNFQTIDTKLKANIVQEFTAIAGQTVFTLSNAYTMGQSEISVEVDGVKQKLGSGYNETTPTSITLLEGLSVGAKVKITIIGLSPGDDSRIDQINTQLTTNTSLLADIALYVRNFPRIVPEIDDAGRLQRALNQAGTNGGGSVNYAENLTFSTITIPSGVVLKGDGFHALTTTTTTGNAIIIGNGTGVSYYTALDHVVISAPNITGNVIYVTKAQHFALPYTRLIGNPSTLTGTGIYIDGTNVGYNAQTNKAYISSFNVGINCVNTSNAHTFFDTFIYNCNYGAIVQGSTGVRFIGCTFQSFLIMGVWFKAAISGSQTTTNTIAFCYIEGLQNGTQIIAGIQIDANVTTTMLYGNHYSYLRPTYPEIIDNGVQTTRSEYSGASWNEPNKQGTLTTLPKVTEGSLPLASAMVNARGSLAIGTSNGVIDLLRVLLNDSSGNPQWMKVPIIDNTGTLNLNGVTVTNTTFAPKPLVGTNVSANTPRFIGDTYVDTNLKLTYTAVGLTSADWKQTSN